MIGEALLERGSLLGREMACEAQRPHVLPLGLARGARARRPALPAAGAKPKTAAVSPAASA